MRNGCRESCSSTVEPARRHAHEQARRWATLGYAVLACDMYGTGVAGDRERVVSEATRLRDAPGELRARAEAALGVLEPWSEGRPAVIGYCFGGMVALNLARAGLPLAAVVSIHGSLATVSPARRELPRPRSGLPWSRRSARSADGRDGIRRGDGGRRRGLEADDLRRAMTGSRTGTPSPERRRASSTTSVRIDGRSMTRRRS